MQPDRGHLHHKLIDMGYSQKQTVLVMYSLSGALGLSAIVLADKGFCQRHYTCNNRCAAFVIGGARYMLEMDDVEIPEKYKPKEEMVSPVVNEIKDQQ